MFFEPSIKKGLFPILEVGPGALPSEFSDVWLDMDFGADERLAQSGFVKPASGKPTVYYDGNKFPFKDKSFKYVIASHVLEHIPWEKVPLFLSELERVAAAGYIELPRWTYELINNIPVHVSTGDVTDGVLHLYKKTTQHDYDFFTSRLMTKSKNFSRYVREDKNLYFCQLEWRNKVPVSLHSDGYPLAGNKKEIVAALESDCDRYLPATDGLTAFLVPSLISFFKKVTERIRGKIIREIDRIIPDQIRNSIFSVGKPMLMSEKEILKILRCPLCGSDIKPDLSCGKCRFCFHRDKLEYHPHY